MKKIFGQAESLNVYKKLADDKADGGDLLGALGLYLTVLKTDKKNLSAIADVADCYADMGLLELSNKYWFLYLTVAPKDKQSVAFEELAINYFYMDNLWVSSYYFHLKVERDGFIAEEGLDEEIIKFFSSPAIRRDAYFLAYPFDKADYSGLAKIAKRAFSAGDIPRAIREYRKIPEECRTEEISGDFATALFLAKKDDEAIKVCKDSIARHGKNVSAYCNLSSVYSAQGDSDKAEYYYRRALSARKGVSEENYKIAACAIERGDHKTANTSVSAILKERPYDDVMNFFYALSLMNLGEYENAKTAMANALKLNPADYAYRYYYELFNDISQDFSLADEYMPFKYVKAFPAKFESEVRKEINRFINGKAPYALLEDIFIKNMLKAALYFEDVKTAKNAAFLIGSSKSVQDKELINAALIDSEIDDEVKNSLIYLLIFGGEKGKINAVINNCFSSVKPRKVVFERKKGAEIFMSAYALILVKCLSWGIEDTAKIAFNMNVLYTDFAETIRFNGFRAEDIATLCYLMCDFKRQENVKNVCAAFGVNKSSVSLVEEFYAFVKKTEPIKLRERAKTALEKEKRVD